MQVNKIESKNTSRNDSRNNSRKNSKTSLVPDTSEFTKVFPDKDEEQEKLRLLEQQRAIVYKEEQNQVRISQLTLKRKKGPLSIAEMFELAKLQPTSLGEIEIESKIRMEMNSMVNSVAEKNRENEKRTNDMTVQMAAFNNMIGAWKMQMSKLPQIEKETDRCKEAFVKFSIQHTQQDALVSSLNAQFKLKDDKWSKKFEQMDAEVKRIHEDQTRQKNLVDRIGESEQRIMDMVEREIEKAVQILTEEASSQKAQILQNSFTVDRNNRMYERMKEDICRHEQLCFEIATKFDEYNTLINSLTASIESLKEYALVNDLHMEAYLPLQIASISYDVSNILNKVSKGPQEKFKKYYVQKIIQRLERNCLNVCDPKIDYGDSKYKKMTYKIPGELMKYSEDAQLGEDGKEVEQKKWSKILSKVTLGNIHLHQLNQRAKQNQFVKNPEDVRSGMGESVVRRADSSAKILLLSGLPQDISENAKSMPLQKKFEEVQKKNYMRLKEAIDTSQMKRFEQENESKIKELLNYGNLERKTLLQVFSPQAQEDDEEEIQHQEQLRKQMQKDYEDFNKNSDDEEINNKDQDEGSSSLSSEHSTYEGMENDDQKTRKKKRKQIKQEKQELDEKLDQALYSKHYVPQRKKSSSRNLYGNMIKQTLERDRQWTQFKNANEVRLTEQEKQTEFKLQELHSNLKEELQVGEEAIERAFKEKMARMKEACFEKIVTVEKFHDEQLEELYSKLRDQEGLISDLKEQLEREPTIESSESTPSYDSESYGQLGSIESKSSVSNSAESFTLSAAKSKKDLPEVFEEDSKDKESIINAKDAMQDTEEDMLKINTEIVISKPENMYQKEQNKKVQNSKEFKRQDTKVYKKQDKLSPKKQDSKKQESKLEKTHKLQSGNLKVAKLKSKNGSCSVSFRENESVHEEKEDIVQDLTQINNSALKKNPRRIVSNKSLGKPLIQHGFQNLVQGTKNNKKAYANIMADQFGDRIAPVRQSTFKKKVGIEEKIAKARVNATRIVSSNTLSGLAIFGNQEVQTPLEHRSGVINAKRKSQISTQNTNDYISVRAQESGLIRQDTQALQRLQTQFLLQQNFNQKNQADTKDKDQDKMSFRNTRRNTKDWDKCSRRSKRSKKNTGSLSPTLRKSSNIKKTDEKKPSGKLAKRNYSSSSFQTDSDFGQSSISGESNCNRRYGGINPDEFEEYKEKVEDIHKRLCLDIINIQAEQQTFTNANIEVLKKFDEVDVTLMAKAEKLAKDTNKELRNIVDNFETTMSGKFRNWQNTSTQIQVKFESFSLWIKMFSELTKTLKDELFKTQLESRNNIEELSQYINFQILKDIQDDIDRDSFGLYGLQEKEKQQKCKSPVSGQQNSVDIRQNSLFGQSVDIQEPSLEQSQSFALQNVSLMLPGLREHDNLGNNKKNKGQLMNAFKLACLNYKSSQIPMPNGDLMSRKQVTSLQQNNLQKLWQSLKAQAESQIETQKAISNLKESNYIVENDPRLLQSSVTNVFNQVMKGKSKERKKHSQQKQYFKIDELLEQKESTSSSSVLGKMPVFSKPKIENLKITRQVTRRGTSPLEKLTEALSPTNSFNSRQGSRKKELILSSRGDLTSKRNLVLDQSPISEMNVLQASSRDVFKSRNKNMPPFAKQQSYLSRQPSSEISNMFSTGQKAQRASVVFNVDQSSKESLPDAGKIRLIEVNQQKLAETFQKQQVQNVSKTAHNSPGGLSPRTQQKSGNLFVGKSQDFNPFKTQQIVQRPNTNQKSRVKNFVELNSQAIDFIQNNQSQGVKIKKLSKEEILQIQRQVARKGK